MDISINTSNRIDRLFEEKKEGILSVFFTAGYPEAQDTATIIQALAEAGVDMIEIGIPFSDPIADGPTIQDSNQKALDNGMNLKKLISQLEGIREKVDIPLLLMGYLNPVVQFGEEAFCEACEQIGIDGLILPDLPMFEYTSHYQPLFAKHGLRNVFLITPQTSEDRIREIDQQTKGFIYMVSSASVTGAKSGISEQQVQYFERIKAIGLENPTVIGFGISNNETFEQACQYASGAIIGSAFIKMLSNSDNLKEDIHSFVQQIRG